VTFPRVLGRSRSVPFVLVGLLCTAPFVHRAICALGRLCTGPLVHCAICALCHLCTVPLVHWAACALGRLCCVPGGDETAFIEVS
jgi:hypothetical protein